MRKRVLTAHFLILAFCLTSRQALGHLGVHEELKRLDGQIQEDPDNAELYVRRGDLHGIHRDWQAAEEDFATARRLQPDLLEVDLFEGQMRLEAGEHGQAVKCLDRFLKHDPGHVKGLVCRARAFACQGKYREAAADYSAAISQFHAPRNPRPEMYLERAKAQSSLGGEFLEAAIRGLDAGLAKLGPVVSLELYAVELEVRKGDYKAALSRVRRAGASAQNKVSWLVREGEILEAWKHEREAREAYSGALEALKAQGNRKTPASRSLQGRLEEAVERLSRDGARTVPQPSAPRAAAAP